MTVLELQSQCGEKSLTFLVLCPQNGTAVSKTVKNSTPIIIVTSVDVLHRVDADTTAAYWLFEHEAYHGASVPPQMACTAIFLYRSPFLGEEENRSGD